MPLSLPSRPPGPRTPRSAHRLPASRARHLGAEDARRVSALLADGTHAVASSAALVLVDDEGVRQRYVWHEVDHASFDADTATLTVRFVDGTRPQLALVTAGQHGAGFLTAVRERIEWSIIHLEQSVLSDGTRVRVTLRRDPDGAVFSQVTTLGTPRLTEQDRAKIDDMVRRVRGTIGLDEDEAAGTG